MRGGATWLLSKRVLFDGSAAPARLEREVCG